MKQSSRIRTACACTVALLIVAAAAACSVDDPSLNGLTDARAATPAPTRARVEPSALRNVFWGDLHIHTSYSNDAYTLGVRALPDDAYRYAKGETIEHALGYPIRATRPLDFAAVTDHAEFLNGSRTQGAASNYANPLREIAAGGNPLRMTWHFIRAGMRVPSQASRPEVFAGVDPAVSQTAWQAIIAAAERHNDPARFTAFIGYEWTSMPNDDNLHRNVIYRGTRVPAYPFSSDDSEDPEALWAALDEQREQGMTMMAIPHNQNLSNGRMYGKQRFAGEPFDAAYAARRIANEPISEIFQVKGQSETHPALGADEFANFELLEQKLSASGEKSEPSGSYAREALGDGLRLAATLGTNPYRFGVIGASDGHNASSPVEEDRFHGKLPSLDGSAAIRLGKMLWLPESLHRAKRWSAMGLAGVWAEENTREALYDALARRECYATSGPRISVRFFGSWDFAGDPRSAANPAAHADARGVPMGGVLHATSAKGPPTFFVLAGKDPIGAHLDRIQIVKGWLDEDGNTQERIFDVAASGDRLAAGKGGELAPVGSTVDLAQASYTNEIGAAQLSSLWTDTDFDPARAAFYYARVIEIPTPRWSTYDARVLGIDPPKPGWLQERAVTSAIWTLP